MMRWIMVFVALVPGLAAASCFEQAAARYKVPVELLQAISTVESGGRANAYNANKNGSFDIGHMQINSSWLPTLAKYNIDVESLQDPCINTNIGAWVLAHNIARFGLSWEAVGAYNAASKSKREIYAKKVAAVLGELVRKKQAQAAQNVGPHSVGRENKVASLNVAKRR